MITDKVKQIIKEQIGKLPTESQQAINSFDWLAIITEIGNANKLLDADINALAIETTLAMCAISNPDLFAKNIEEEVLLSKEEAEKIEKEIEEKIFNPIMAKIPKKEEKKEETVENLDFILSGGQTE